MKAPRPDIFISAATADLGSCRRIIKDALLTLGCTPIEQTNFPPDAQSVRDMLREKIAACDAVIHIAGHVYGAEPVQQQPGEPRRSYTQLEYDIAQELARPVYVFICGDGFPYDEHEPEDDERQALQRAHRERLAAGDHLFTPVASRDELTLRIHQLQIRVERLATALQRIEVIETELGEQRRYIMRIADVYSRQQAELAELKLSDEERFNRALAKVAQESGVPEAELRAAIALFVAAVKADPEAEFMDRALVEFADRRFNDAAQFAAQAAAAARGQRLAAEALAEAAQRRADAARDQEREALTLQGRSLNAAWDFEAAINVFNEVLAITPRQTLPMQWADTKANLGIALLGQANETEGPEKYRLLADAVAGCRAALEVRTRDATPQLWAITQASLGAALLCQAIASEDPEAARLMVEACMAYGTAIKDGWTPPELSHEELQQVIAHHGPSGRTALPWRSDIEAEIEAAEGE